MFYFGYNSKTVNTVPVYKTNFNGIELRKITAITSKKCICRL